MHVQSAVIGALGLQHDRNYMLLRVDKYGTYSNMSAKTAPRNSSLRSYPHDSTSFQISTTLEDGEGVADANSSITIPYELSDLGSRPRIQIEIHGAPILAYEAGEPYDSFFTSALLPDLDERCKLVYLAGLEHGNSRTALGNNVPPGKAECGKISFADCASYLITNKASLDDLSVQLGHQIDIIPLRPNLLVDGDVDPWDEDYWREIKIGQNEDAVIFLVNNCGRCTSINIDYNKGEMKTSGDLPFKTLSKYRSTSNLYHLRRLIVVDA